MGLRDEDFHPEFEWVHIQRSSVGKHQAETKTETPDEYLPIHEDLRPVLRVWLGAKISVNGWVFESPITGCLYHGDSLQDDYLAPAGRKIGLPGLGWHSFPHTCRAMLRKSDTPLEIQQQVMRHANIQTTIGYGGEMQVEEKRPANTKVVEMLRRAS